MTVTVKLIFESVEEVSISPECVKKAVRKYQETNKKALREAIKENLRNFGHCQKLR